MKKHLRFWGRFLLTLLKRYYILFVAGLILGPLSFWLAPRIIAQMPKPQPVERIGVIGGYNESNLPEFILKKVSIGLTQVEPNGAPYPGIGASWTSDKEGKTWTFHLTQDLMWSDNTQITAYDISYQFRDVNIEIIDEKTIRYHLPDPFAPFSAVVSKPIFKGNFIGIGPYKLVGIKRAGQYLQTMEYVSVSKNTNLPRLQYRFYPTEEAAKLGFKLGEIDQIVDLVDPSGFEGWPNVTVEKEVKNQRYVGLFFNQKKPDLKQKNIRQALAYAIKDKSFGQPRSLSTIPSTSWAYNPNVKTYDYDLDRAKTLYKDAASGNQLQLAITTVPTLLNVAQTIAKDWEALNVKATVSVTNTLPEDFDVLLVVQEVPEDPDQYSLWHSTQTTNIIGYQNPKIDKLLEDGRRTIDREERTKIYQDFQRFLNEDLPVIFLFSPSTYEITRQERFSFF